MHFLMECKETLPIDSPDDPFYSESNMKHLAAVIADVEAGKNMAVHELIDDEELLDAMKEAKEIATDSNIKSYSTMEELKAALE